MRYDIHLRSDLWEMVNHVLDEIVDWNAAADSRDSDDVISFSKRAVTFDHCGTPDRPFLIGGADGSGDFPCVKYADVFVYYTQAMSRLYQAVPGAFLKECEISDAPAIRDILWLPAARGESDQRLKNSFSRMLGAPLEDICTKSDYYRLKKEYGRAPADELGLIGDRLILPPNHESNNLSIQLMTVAECASLLRLIRSDELDQLGPMPVYLLEDTTLSLPTVKDRSVLFFEVAKRYACVAALEKNIAFMTISKSHNMPYMDQIEALVADDKKTNEHWFIRIPASALGEETPTFLEERTIPPAGAVSYLFKLHKTTQPMRLDMDYRYWHRHIRSEDRAQERAREIQLFRDLDFASHDQRCYGYPYPIKACHDMVSMTEPERIALRKGVIDRAAAKGLKRKNFVDPEIQTGHS